MSSGHFSIFKKRKRPTTRRVVVAGSEKASWMLLLIDNRRFEQEEDNVKRTNISFYDMSLGSRCPERPLMDLYIEDTVAFVFVFQAPPEQYYLDIFRHRKSDLHYLVNKVKKSVILVLFDHPSEEFGTRDPTYDDWVKEVGENHKTATFDVSTACEKGMEEPYEWLSKQIFSSLEEEETIKKMNSEKKNLGFRWLTKLSKTALTFGSHSS